MTDSERQQILKMIEQGKISAEEGLKLMQALADSPTDTDEAPAFEPTPEPAEEQVEVNSGHRPEFDEKLRRFRQLWVIPLVLGVLVTIGGAWLMYSAMQGGQLGFWFACATLPFLIGVALVALAFSSRGWRWLYLNVRQKPGERPQHIILAFPIPTGMISWGLNNFGHKMPERERKAADLAVKSMLQGDALKEPLFVDVQEDDGEHVQVYIG